MASIFDLGALEVFMPVFVFLFIFVVLYAILEKTKLFGENARTLNVVAAFSLAIISIFTGKMVNLIAFITPWFALVFIIILLITTMFMFFSVKPIKGVIGKGIGEHSFWTLIGEMPVFVILLIIVFVGLTTVFESNVSPYKINDHGQMVDDGGNIVPANEIQQNPRSETVKALTHPRMLSALFMLILASVAVKFIVDKYEP